MGEDCGLSRPRFSKIIDRLKDLDMPHDQHTHPPEAYARLAASLCHAMAQFLTDNAAKPGSVRNRPSDANASEAVKSGQAKWPKDPMTLNEVKFELRLNEAQIVKLRRLWGFPSPMLHEGRFVFSRGDVESWARLQPNPNKLAAVLRLRSHWLAQTE